MLTINHDTSALRAQLAIDFAAVAHNATQAPHVVEIVQFFLETALHILRDLSSEWNEHNALIQLPQEVLAACFSHLPFADRIHASHVSRSWRAAALSFPEVWADIELSPYYLNPSAVLRMGLSRTGGYPVDFTYLSSGRTEQPAIVQELEQHIGHMRSIIWDSHAKGPRLDLPAPMLRSLQTDCKGTLPVDFLGGRTSCNLTRLFLYVLDLPDYCPALSSVTTLAGGVPPAPQQAACLIRLFQLFPRLDSLSLLGLRSGHEGCLPLAPPPRSLSHLLLAAESTMFDAVRQYLVWRTDELKDVVLSSAHYIPADLPLGTLFADVVDMAIHMDIAGQAASWALRDATGHSITFECTRMRPQVPADISSYMLALSTAPVPGLSALRALSVSADVLEQYIHAAPPLPGLQSLHITLCESGDAYVAQGRRWFPWSWLDCLAQAARYAPVLETLVLELRCFDEGRHPSPADARTLLALFASLCSADITEVHIRGFPPDVVPSIEIPREVKQRVVFDQ